MAGPMSRESPNSRLNAIRKFLLRPPLNATRLRLLVSDTPPIALGEWAPLSNEDQRDILADEIEGLLVDHAGEHRRYKMGYLLSWCLSDGSQVTAKQLSVYGHQLRDDTPEDTVRDLDGTALSQVSQCQRHMEAMMRLHLQWQGQIVQTMSATIDRLSERCATIETATGSRHDELLDAKETILGLLNESAQDQLSPGQAKALDIAEKVIPSLMIWLQTQAAQKAAAAPPAPKPPTNGASHAKAST